MNRQIQSAVLALLLLGAGAIGAATAAPAKPQKKSSISTARARKLAARRAAAAARRDAAARALRLRARAAKAPLPSRHSPGAASRAPLSTLLRSIPDPWKSLPRLTMLTSGPYAPGIDLRPDLVLLDSGERGGDLEALVAGWRAAGHQVHVRLPFLPEGAAANGDSPLTGLTAWMERRFALVRRLRAAGAVGFWLEPAAFPLPDEPDSALRSFWRAETGAAWTGAPAERGRLAYLLGDRALEAAAALITRIRAESAGGERVRLVGEVETPMQLARRRAAGQPAALASLDFDAIAGYLDSAPPDQPAAMLRAWADASYLQSLSLPGGLPLLLGETAVKAPASAHWIATAVSAGGPAGLVCRVDDSAGIAAAGLARSAGPHDTVALSPIAVPLFHDAAWASGADGADPPAAAAAQALLSSGIEVRLVAGERLEDRRMAETCSLLVLDDTDQSTRSASTHAAIAGWVRSGGGLLLLGTGTALADGLWWRQDGYPSASEQLLRQLGLESRAGEIRVMRGRGFDAAHLVDMEGGRVLAVADTVTAEQPLLLRIGASGEDEPWLGRVRVLSASGRVRADFVAGGSGEAPFLVEDGGRIAADGGRTVTGRQSFVYRFARLESGSRVELALKGPALIEQARGRDPRLRLEPRSPDLPPLILPSYAPLRLSPPAGEGARVLYEIEGAPAVWIREAGAGRVLFAGIPGGWFAETPSAAAILTRLVRAAAPAAVQPAPRSHFKSGAWFWRRPQPVEPSPLPGGLYLNLLQPELPPADASTASNWPLALPLPAQSGLPALLLSTARVEQFEHSGFMTAVRVSGAAGSTGLIRLTAGSLQLAGVEAGGAAVESRVQASSVLIRLPLNPAGQTLLIRWRQPEARLTK